MNYFAHAFAFLDDPNADPHFVAGTALPDWLTVADRQVRLRAKHVGPLLEEDKATAALACGLLQHWADDAWFHATRAFAETSLGLSVLARGALGEEAGMRAAFLGHLLTELLLDASLVAEDPRRLSRYYDLLAAIDGGWLQRVVNRVAPRPTERLAPAFSDFCSRRILWDYLEDGKLLVRLGQVMRRLGLAELPEHFEAILPQARRLVESRKSELLGAASPPCRRRSADCLL
jgi:hypothetical protein